MLHVRCRRAIGLCAAIVLLSLGYSAVAGLPDDPGSSPNCSFNQVTAQLGPDASIRYNGMGECNNVVMTGEMSYGPNQTMAEKFFYKGATLRVTALCPADPWSTGAPCRDRRINAQGIDPGPFLQLSVPLSLRIERQFVFQQARANAAKPAPPGAPVNPKGLLRVIPPSNLTAHVSWLGPSEEAPNGPYLNFVIQARPQNSAAAAWTQVGTTPRRSAVNYALVVRLPPPVKGTNGWELRACSATVLATTCTSPFLPAQDLARPLNKNVVAPTPPAPATSKPVLIKPIPGVTK